MNGKTPATRTRVGKYELGKTLGEELLLRSSSRRTLRMVIMSPLRFSIVKKFFATGWSNRYGGLLCFLGLLCYLLITQILDFIVYWWWWWCWQIKREISTLKVIKHPNVCKIYEVPWSIFLDFISLYSNTLLVFLYK